MTPFGLFFLGFSLFWEYSVFQSFSDRTPGFATILFPIWDIPFILVGFYISIGRYFWDAYRRNHTTYLLTNRRALIETTAFGKKLISVRLNDLNEVDLEERSDGAGTIALGQDIQVGSGDNSRTKRAPRFEFINDSLRVYKLLEEARKKSRSEPAGT